MNRERAKELLPIIQAFAEGKQIQYRTQSDRSWRRAASLSLMEDMEYRLSPREALEALLDDF